MSWEPIKDQDGAIMLSRLIEMWIDRIPGWNAKTLEEDGLEAGDPEAEETIAMCDKFHAVSVMAKDGEVFFVLVGKVIYNADD